MNNNQGGKNDEERTRKDIILQTDSRVRRKKRTNQEEEEEKSESEQDQTKPRAPVALELIARQNQVRHDSARRRRGHVLLRLRNLLEFGLMHLLPNLDGLQALLDGRIGRSGTVLAKLGHIGKRHRRERGPFGQCLQAVHPRVVLALEIVVFDHALNLEQLELFGARVLKQN